MKSLLELLCCVYASSYTHNQANQWMGQQAGMANRPQSSPCRLLRPEEELPRYCRASADRSRVGRERMMTWLGLGLLSPLITEMLATGRAVDHRNQVCGCSPQPCYSSPSIVSSLSCGIKAQLTSALRGMHLWPGGSPDCIVNGTSCFLNQEQRLYNDNPEHHSNTIGRY